MTPHSLSGPASAGDAHALSSGQSVAIVLAALAGKLLEASRAAIEAHAALGRGEPVAAIAGPSRHDKLALLASAVNWERYTELGLDEQTPLRIIFNAVDGKAPEQWLTQTPEEASARRAELGGYFDAVRAARETMDHAADFDRDLARSAARGQAEGKGRDRGPELE